MNTRLIITGMVLAIVGHSISGVGAAVHQIGGQLPISGLHAEYRPPPSPYLLLAQAAPPNQQEAQLAPVANAEAMIWVDATNGLWNGTRGRQDRPFNNLGRALAVAQSGDVILLRPGVYRREGLDRQLARSVSIIGSGMYNTTLLVTNVNLREGQVFCALNSHLPTMTNAGTYLELSDLTIDCNGANIRLATRSKISGAYLTAESVRIENVRVLGAVQETLETFAVAASARRSIIRNCRVENTGKAYLTGVMAGGGDWDRVESIMLEGNWVNGMGAWPSVGVGVASAQNVQVLNNTATNVTHGVMCDTGGLTNAIISGNILHGVSAPRTTRGFYLAYYSSRDVSFEGNLVMGFDNGVMFTYQSGPFQNSKQQHLRLRLLDNSFVDCKTNIWVMNLVNSRVTGNRANTGTTAFHGCRNVIFADNTMESGGPMAGITNAFYSTPGGVAFDSQPPNFNRLPSRSPANAKRPWLWLPIQVDGTNAVVPVYR